MAVAASLFRDFLASFFHPNRFVKVARGERVRMPEAVIRLDIVFADEVVRCMAVVTGGDRPMARLDPCFQVSAHDVAVGASARIIGQIRPTLGIKKSIAADTDSESKNDTEDDRRGLLGCCRFHLSNLLTVTRLSNLRAARRTALSRRVI